MTKLSISFQLHTCLNRNGQQYDLDPILLLLQQIQLQENLREAAVRCKYSYRKAWNLLKQSENLFDQALVIKQRGKGTQLSNLGQLLLETSLNNNNQFKESLFSAENKFNTALNSQLSDSQPLIIIASDSEKLDKLRQLHFPIELHIKGSGLALSAYAEGKCELAGFHLGMGKDSQKLIDNYAQHFNPEQDQFIMLEQRLQGLISHPENPVDSIRQLIDQQLIFVNRQIRSGTRQLLDRLLNEQNIRPELLTGYYHEEHTHLAVASMISTRQADAGLGIQSAAARLNLQFTPLKNELYFLVFKTITPRLQQVLDRLTEKKPLKAISYKKFIEALA